VVNIARLHTRPWLGYAAALAAVAAATLPLRLLFELTDKANVSMAYLIPVLATAILFGRGPAVLASVLAFLTYDLLFVDPYYQLTVSDETEWVTLVLLLVTGVVVAQLAADQRRKAQDARQREREAVVLYDVVRRLAGPDLKDAMSQVAAGLRDELGLAAVVIDLDFASPVRASAAAGEPEAIELARSERLTPEHVLTAAATGNAGRHASAGRWVKIVPGRGRAVLRRGGVRRVPIEYGGGRLGSITLVTGETNAQISAADDRLLSAAATQIAQTLERERFRRDATETEILRRTDELKTALLNAVSHDLRTPLASIIASAGSLRQDDVDWSDEDRRDFAEAIEEEAQRLNRIVGNLLDLSRIEAGILRPERGWYDFAALVDDVLGRLRQLAPQHILRAEVPDDLPPVSLDLMQIDQVLSNLVENAIKYTPAGTEITVSAALKDGSELATSVCDNGPGIRATALPHLFERFYRGAENGRRPRGTGLGLSVARGLVEAHGGRMTAENRPDGGARLVFTLPLRIVTTRAKTRD
jgi:two-component system, OmpR family, sensor histidine kinase KdpD